MKLVWIASPLRGNTEENLAYARCAAANSIARGEAPFVPHLLYPQLLDDTLEDERAKGMQLGWDWMAASDKVVFYVDRGWSKGMIRDLKVARRLLGKPIEVRRLNAATVTAPDEIGLLLIEAGIVEPRGEIIPGIQMFAFREHDK